jgi:hypothetical protein
MDKAEQHAGTEALQAAGEERGQLLLLLLLLLLHREWGCVGL